MDVFDIFMMFFIRLVFHTLFFCNEDMSCLTRSGDLTVLGRAVAAIPVQPNVRGPGARQNVYG